MILTNSVFGNSLEIVNCILFLKNLKLRTLSRFVLPMCLVHVYSQLRIAKKNAPIIRRLIRVLFIDKLSVAIRSNTSRGSAFWCDVAGSLSL